MANVRCYGCNQEGHYKQHCPNRPELTRPAGRPSPAAHCCDAGAPWPEAPEEWWEQLHEADPVQAAADDNRRHHRQAVWINGRPAEGLRDSGATITLVRPHLVPPSDRLQSTVAVRVAGGKVLRLETARVHLDWGNGEKEVRVGLLRQLPAEVLLGNDLGQLISAYSTDAATPVTTRQQSRRQDRGAPNGTQVRPPPPPSRPPKPPKPPRPPRPPNHSRPPRPSRQPKTPGPSQPPRPPSPPRPRRDPILSPPPVLPSPWSTPETLRHQTQTDPTLQGYRDRAGQGLDGQGKDKVEWEDGLLYRYTVREGAKKKQIPQKQLVVPQGPRQELLRLAHDIPLAGHLGQSKTRHRLARAFYWPRLSNDTRDYCRTCPVCQRAGKAGDHPKAPLRPMPIIQEPFSRVAVDIVGPLPRPSATGKRYILTVVDYATRYPEAVALANIQADTVADALLRVFTRVGFPREILSDQGTQFTAELTQQLWRLCGVKALHSAPYHPQTNGLCERFNGTLKQLIRAFVHENRDWEKYLPHLLFAYREVPQESTGYSPFELLYGRRVRGPLDLVRAQWEGAPEEDGVPVVEYVLKLRERLADLQGFVQENMETAQAQQKAWYDRAACSRSFCVGQKVLVLKPQRQNKLQAAWQGPYKVVTQLGDTTYVVVSCADTRIQRTFHVNMLKAFHERPESVDAICAPAAEEMEPFPLEELPGVAKQPSGVEQVQLGEELGPEKQAQARQLLLAYPGFSRPSRDIRTRPSIRWTHPVRDHSDSPPTGSRKQSASPCGLRSGRCWSWGSLSRRPAHGRRPWSWCPKRTVQPGSASTIGG
uniref:Gypsy retrotransposon integrase-like protein 1 n=1 Tax=Leptobrachium leishanense TaxID=445787 RepID=A0A8C5P611_9ANUR